MNYQGQCSNLPSSLSHAQTTLSIFDDLLFVRLSQHVAIAQEPCSQDFDYIALMHFMQITTPLERIDLILLPKCGRSKNIIDDIFFSNVTRRDCLKIFQTSWFEVGNISKPALFAVLLWDFQESLKNLSRFAKN